MSLVAEKLSPVWSKPTRKFDIFSLLDISASEFTFRVKAKGVGNPEAGSLRSRIEGLWEGEVFELFLASTDASKYLEINLDKAGNWWDMGFNEVRKRNKAVLNEDQVSTKTLTTDSQVVSEIRFPVQPVEKYLGKVDTLRVNFTAILRSPTQHYSLSKLSGDYPNFHQPEYFPSISSLFHKRMQG